MLQAATRAPSLASSQGKRCCSRLPKPAKEKGPGSKKPLSESSSALGGARSAPLPVALGRHQAAAPLRRQMPSLSTPHRLPGAPPWGKSPLKIYIYKYLGSFPHEQTWRGQLQRVSWCGIISRGAVGKKILPLGSSWGVEDGCVWCVGAQDATACFTPILQSFLQLGSGVPQAARTAAPTRQTLLQLGGSTVRDQPRSTRFWVPFGKGCSSPAELQPHVSSYWGPARLSQFRSEASPAWTVGTATQTAGGFWRPA